MQKLVSKKASAVYDYHNLSKLTKDETIQLLAFLTDRINKSFIMMGGLLYTIRKNKWYDSSLNFQEFCDTLAGLHYRRVMHLIQIYENLIDNHIPFDEITPLGYTKLVLLSAHMTIDNYKTMLEWGLTKTTQEIEDELKLMAQKSSEFFKKVMGNKSLDPEYVGFNATEKKAHPTLSILKSLLAVTSVEDVVKALALIYPDKDFTLQLT